VKCSVHNYLKVAERLNVLGSVDFACFKVRNPRTRFLHLLTDVCRKTNMRH